MANFHDYISDDLLQMYQDGIDAIIDKLGVTCTLKFKGKVSDCANCVYDPIGKKSANRYATGGPAPFPRGTICPMCGGAGKIIGDNVTEDITMNVYWNPKDWQSIGTDIQTPETIVQVKGYMTDLPSILKAETIIINTAVSPYIEYEFKRFGEPHPMGLSRNRYFLLFLERI